MIHPDYIKEFVATESQEPLDTEALIKKISVKRMLALFEAENCERAIDYLKQYQAKENTVIKWRKEIRDCLENRSSILSTSAEIADCVAERNGLVADRNIKVKISTTLSLMFKEGEIGRLPFDGETDFKYGDKKYFLEESERKFTILRIEYSDLVNGVEARDECC